MTRMHASLEKDVGHRSLGGTLKAPLRSTELYCHSGISMQCCSVTYALPPYHNTTLAGT
jgi:hypothetical protein